MAIFNSYVSLPEGTMLEIVGGDSMITLRWFKRGWENPYQWSCFLLGKSSIFQLGRLVIGGYMRVYGIWSDIYVIRISKHHKMSICRGDPCFDASMMLLVSTMNHPLLTQNYLTDNFFCLKERKGGRERERKRNRETSKNIRNSSGTI